MKRDDQRDDQRDDPRDDQRDDQRDNQRDHQRDHQRDDSDNRSKRNDATDLRPEPRADLDETRSGAEDGAQDANPEETELQVGAEGPAVSPADRSLQTRLAPWLHKLERFVDRVRLRWNLRKRHEWTPTVVPYAALERRDVLRIFARAFQEEPPHPRAREGRLRRLRRMLKRMVIREIPFATLELDVDGVTRQVLADEEGVVDVQAHSPGENGAARVEIRVVHPVRGKAAHVPCSRFARQQENSRFLVISDIDDTVMRMKVLGMRRLIGTILFADASHRTVFEGVPELYRALEGTCGEENPMVYVSSSPWNVHDLVEDFLDLNGVPRGAILLRNWGISDTEILPTRHGAYKRGAIYGVVDFFPDLPAILLGDDAEEDPEIYEQVARDRPGRVEAIFIRRLGRKKSPEENDQRLDRLATTLGERGVPMVVSDSSEEMLAKARQLGIVDSSHARLSNAPT